MRVGSFSLELARAQAFPHVTVHSSAHCIVSLPYSFTSLVFIKITKGLYSREIRMEHMPKIMNNFESQNFLKTFKTF